MGRDGGRMGFLNERGQPFNHKSIATMLAA